MSEPRIVSPEEAQGALEYGDLDVDRLMYTVATEPDRIRAAVVNELRRVAWVMNPYQIMQRADDLENGVDL